MRRVSASDPDREQARTPPRRGPARAAMVTSHDRGTLRHHPAPSSARAARSCGFVGHSPTAKCRGCRAAMRCTHQYSCDCLRRVVYWHAAMRRRSLCRSVTPRHGANAPAPAWQRHARRKASGGPLGDLSSDAPVCGRRSVAGARRSTVCSRSRRSRTTARSAVPGHRDSPVRGRSARPSHRDRDPAGYRPRTAAPPYSGT